MAKRQRKRGPVSKAETDAATAILAANPEASFAAIAKILNRTKHTIIAHVAGARDAFRHAAPFYLEQHQIATQIAAAQGNAAPAQWALSRISLMDGDSEVRITEEPRQRYDTGPAGGQGGLTINVGLAVSQVAPSSSAPFPSVPVLQEVAPIDVTPSKQST
jgi:hypothetical protein